MEQLWLKVNEALCSHESTILEAFPVIYRKRGCIFPSNQHASPWRMCCLPGLCHLVSAWAPTVNPPHPKTPPTLAQTPLHPKRKPRAGAYPGAVGGEWSLHSGKRCLSKCILLANTPHAWPHDWLIIFKTTASNLPGANPTQRGSSSVARVVFFSGAVFFSERQTKG